MKINIAERKYGLSERLAEKALKADIAAMGHYTEFGFMNPDIKFKMCIRDRG